MMNGDGINRYSPLGGGGDGQEKGKKRHLWKAVTVFFTSLNLL